MMNLCILSGFFFYNSYSLNKSCTKTCFLKSKFFKIVEYWLVFSLLAWTLQKNQLPLQVGLYYREHDSCCKWIYPKDIRDIPYHRMSRSTYKDGGRRKKGAHSEKEHFVFLGNCHTWWSPAFLGMGEHLPAYEKWGINSLLCSCMWFCLIYQTIYISTHNFIHFYLFQFVPPSHCRGVREQLCGT